MILNVDPKIIFAIIPFGIAAILAIFGIRLSKRHFSETIRKLRNSLLQAGIKATETTDSNYYLEKIGKTMGKTSDFYEGVFVIHDAGFSYILYRKPGSYGIYDHWDYIVTRNALTNKTTKTDRSIYFYERATRLCIKKDVGLFGKATNLSWKGDDSLSRVLNADYLLNEKLLGILQRKRQPKSIFIFWRNTFAVIRTPIYTHIAEDFEIFNTISLHIKSTWFH